MSSESPFKPAQEEAPKALVSVTRTAGLLAGEDLGFYRASNPAGAKQLDRQNARLLSLAKRLIKSATVGTAVSAPKLKDSEDVDDNWHGIVEVVDSLLEKADIALDEYTGVIKKLTPAQEEQAPLGSLRRTRENAALGMRKPQLLFNNIPTNDETTAWKPLLKSKPNATVPLDETTRPSEADPSFQE